MESDDRAVQTLLAAVRRALEPLDEVAAALVFGSRAQGRAREDSDIDVAVLLRKEPPAEHRKDELRRLIEALGSELASDRLDVIVLDDAPPVLAFQVLKHGKEALVRDPVALHRYRVRTYSLHADYAPIERFFREVTRRRALAQEPKRG